MTAWIAIPLYLIWLASWITAHQYLELRFKPWSASFHRQYRQYGQPSLDLEIYCLVGLISLPVMVLIMRFGGRLAEPVHP